MNNGAQLAYQSIHSCLKWGAVLVCIIVFGIGGWAGTTELSGAIVAPGVLVVESTIKKIQHQAGGSVAELRVKEGDHVNAGDVVIRLDETQARASLAIVNNNLDYLRARLARLEAERDGASVIDFPMDLIKRAGYTLTTTPSAPTSTTSLADLRPSIIEPITSITSHDVAEAIATERRLFEVRIQARDGQKAQLKERILQLREEIVGFQGQIAAKTREVSLINQELEGVRELWQKNLVSLSRVNVLERDAARIDGERSQLFGSAAQAKGKIAEIELQLLQVDRDLQTEVSKDLAEVRSKVSELLERRIAAEDQLKHIDIRTPLSGKILQLAVHSVGAVIAAGEAVMMIVPDQDALTVEVKISPLDIDQVSLGQTATVKFSSFNQRITPEIVGKVHLISADLTQDQRSGTSYYMARISLEPLELSPVRNMKLIPGMPAEVFIKTGERTVLSYLTKPIRDQAARAFTER